MNRTNGTNKSEVGAAKELPGRIAVMMGDEWTAEDEAEFQAKLTRRPTMDKGEYFNGGQKKHKSAINRWHRTLSREEQRRCALGSECPRFYASIRGTTDWGDWQTSLRFWSAVDALAGTDYMVQSIKGKGGRFGYWLFPVDPQVGETAVYLGEDELTAVQELEKFMGRELEKPELLLGNALAFGNHGSQKTLVPQG